MEFFKRQIAETFASW